MSPRRLAPPTIQLARESLDAWLLLGLRREGEGIAGAAAELRALRRFGLGDVLGEYGDYADPPFVRGHHHAVGLILVHAEHGLEHLDDELPRRVVVVEQDNLVEPRPFCFRLNLCARFGSN